MNWKNFVSKKYNNEIVNKNRLVKGIKLLKDSNAEKELWNTEITLPSPQLKRE